MKKILTAIAVLMFATAAWAMVSFVDDDPIQYITVNTSGQTVPAGAEMHLWVSTTGVSGFSSVGVLPTGQEVTISLGGVTNLSGTNLTINHTGDYWLYTQYQMYVSDLDSTLYGVTSDTAHFNIVVPVMPIGEAINVTLDK